MDKKLLEIVFDNLYNGIYVVDGKGVTIGVNKTFEEMSGFSNAELTGRNLRDLVGEDNYFSGSASLLVLERKCPVTATYSTSTNRKFLVKGRPIFNHQGKIEYIINTIWDLTVVHYNHQIDADTARSQILSDDDFITCSEKMSSVIDLALRVAETDSTILLTGESGVGKSLLAKTIHRSSERKQKVLMKINCAAIPESLIESELFGYEGGAFTGADNKGKAGLLEIAKGGTVFLDEISELPLHLQSKLLGVIQDKEFYRVGGREAQRTDIRLIAATNKDLVTLVSEGQFREDLYYRLNVVPIAIPPLRERREDIPTLIQHFTEKYNRKYNSYKKLSENLINQMVSMPWKGNIRELENVVERSIVTTLGDFISWEKVQIPGIENIIPKDIGLKEMLAEQEKEILLQAQKKYKTTRRIAAALGISQATTARKLKAINDTLLDQTETNNDISPHLPE
ncbi:PAS domain S-box-containing protein [Desulfuromusa kysingii]|uniref:HTH-type transcriptional regulatory protein TyrR n=1 Tax=Desulfuromusa kysingii TaxID=37625 RepID=A0A1H3XII4_9BACT|nr:sigma 54-interacting transcriptional regulator [Desulfuromusa kysingii]SDZ99070.1 PAS domain S-box-containing protein [Desulfuromusa kysingii]